MNKVAPTYDKKIKPMKKKNDEQRSDTQKLSWALVATTIVSCIFCFWPIFLEKIGVVVTVVSSTDFIEFEDAYSNDFNFQASALSCFIVSFPSMFSAIAGLIFKASRFSLSFVCRTQQISSNISSVSNNHAAPSQSTSAAGSALTPLELLFFLLGSSTLSLIVFFPSYWPFKFTWIFYNCWANVSTILNASPILLYLHRSCASWTFTVTFTILISTCLSAVLNSAKYVEGFKILHHASIGFVIISTSIFVGTCIMALIRHIRRLNWKAIGHFTDAVLLHEGIFEGGNSDDFLTKLDFIYTEIVPALHMISAIVIYAVTVTWYLTPAENVEGLTTFNWGTFVGTVCVLLIELNVKESAVQRGLLCAVGTVKKSYVRYISHELRTPLNAISSGLKVLTMEAESIADVKLRDERLDLLACITVGCDAAVDVLNDMLAYDKIDSGTFLLRLQEVEVVPFLMECTRMFGPVAHEKNINLQTSLFLQSMTTNQWCEQGASPLLQNDSARIDVFKLRQVIRNVLSNAFKFSAEGGSVVVKAWVKEIDTSDGNISPWTRMTSIRNFSIENNAVLGTNSFDCPPRTFVRISVSDSGPGIDENSQQQLFSEIFQFKPELLQGGGGSGLGLFISKRIMNDHGGDICVHSEGIGKGCTFSIDLPLLPREQSFEHVKDIRLLPPVETFSRDDVDAKVQSSSVLFSRSHDDQSDQNLSVLAPERKSSVSIRLLVVDDSSVSRKLFIKLAKSLMKGTDVYTDECENGADAVQKVEEMSLDGPYDAIFMDSVMPKMDGLTATKQIRELGYIGPIYGVTGNALEEQIQDFLRCGVNEVFIKPLELNQISRVLKHLSGDEEETQILVRGKRKISTA